MAIDPKDDELILRIRQKSDDPKLADEAFVILYERHHQLLYKTLESLDYRLVGFGLDAADIVEETFKKVWDGATSSFNSGSYDKPDSRFVHVQFWLQSIAKNLVKEVLRKPNSMLPIDPSGGNELLFGSFFEDFDIEAQESGKDPCEWLHQLVANTLSEKERAIVWFKVAFYDPVTGKSEPPKDELEDFFRDWKMKQPAFRKAYSRALEKLANAASSSPKLQPSSTELGDSNAYTE